MSALAPLLPRFLHTFEASNHVTCPMPSQFGTVEVAFDPSLKGKYSTISTTPTLFRTPPLSPPRGATVSGVGEKAEISCMEDVSANAFFYRSEPWNAAKHKVSVALSVGLHEL